MARKSKNSRKSEEGDWHLPTQRRNSSVKKLNEINKGGLIDEEEIIHPNINDNERDSYRDKLLKGKNLNDDFDMSNRNTNNQSIDDKKEDSYKKRLLDGQDLNDDIDMSNRNINKQLIKYNEENKDMNLNDIPNLVKDNVMDNESINDPSFSNNNDKVLRPSGKHNLIAGIRNKTKNINPTQIVNTVLSKTDEITYHNYNDVSTMLIHPNELPGLEEFLLNDKPKLENNNTVLSTDDSNTLNMEQAEILILFVLRSLIQMIGIYEVDNTLIILKELGVTSDVHLFNLSQKDPLE